MRRWRTLALASVLAAAPAVASGNGVPRPFLATFAVSYGGISVGTSELELRPDETPGRWVFESRSNARGFARIVVGSQLSQRSVLEVDGTGTIRPLQYRFDDGTSSRAKDVALDFDWAAGRITGTAEQKPVDLATVPGLQDALTMQLAAMAELAAGRQPEKFTMIEKDETKVYEYRFLRSERLTTPQGEFDTLVYRSSRPGAERYSLQWFAPALGYLSVRSEQHRGKKALFTLRLQRHTVPAPVPAPSPGR